VEGREGEVGKGNVNVKSRNRERERGKGRESGTEKGKGWKDTVRQEVLF